MKGNVKKLRDQIKLTRNSLKGKGEVLKSFIEMAKLMEMFLDYNENNLKKEINND